MPDQPRARGIRPFLTAAAGLAAAFAWVSLPPLAPTDTLTVCLLGEASTVEREG